MCYVPKLDTVMNAKNKRKKTVLGNLCTFRTDYNHIYVDKSVLMNIVLCSVAFKVLSIFSIIIMYHNVLVTTYI